MNSTVHTTDFEKASRARSTSLDRATSSHTAIPAAHNHPPRSYSNPVSGVPPIQPIDYPAFSYQNMAYYPEQVPQTTWGYPSTSSTVHNTAASSTHVQTQRTGHVHSNHHPAASYPEYHYSFVPTLPNSNANASAQPHASEGTWNFAATTPISNQQYPHSASSHQFEPQFIDDQADSDDDNLENSESSSGTALNAPSSAGLPFQTPSNPVTPVSPTLSAEPYVPPQVMHRRSIERKARQKRRAAEREVHALLLSQGIALRGKANMLNALLDLYKARTEEVHQLRDAIAKLKTS